MATFSSAVHIRLAMSSSICDGKPSGFTAPDGSTNTYTYDTLNRLSTLANSWAGSFGFTYDALSRRTKMTRKTS
jgi:YD repeat-containing protein